MAITSYTIVAKRDPVAFATAVQTLINGGSQPFGAPFLNDNNGCMTQVMIEGSQILVGATGAAGADATITPAVWVDSASGTFAADLVTALIGAGLMNAAAD